MAASDAAGFAHSHCAPLGSASGGTSEGHIQLVFRVVVMLASSATLPMLKAPEMPEVQLDRSWTQGFLAVQAFGPLRQS